VETAGYDFEIAVDISKPGDIMQQVWDSIRQLPVIIADLTGPNANVMYEVGVGHASGKHVIMVTQQPGAMPFDVRGSRWCAYRIDELAALDKWLQTSSVEIFKELAVPENRTH